jgi:hypothetical protein
MRRCQAADGASDLKTWPATTRFRWVPEGVMPEGVPESSLKTGARLSHLPGRSCFLIKREQPGSANHQNIANCQLSIAN